MVEIKVSHFAEGETQMGSCRRKNQGKTKGVSEGCPAFNRTSAVVRAARGKKKNKGKKLCEAEQCDSDSSTPREVKKKPTKAGRLTYSESVATSLRIAVIPQSYPENRLSEELLLASVESAMDETPEDSYLSSFLDNWF